MDTKIHYVVTFVSLIFLGVIVAKPGSFNLSQDDRVCKLNKGKMDCSHKDVEFKFNDAANVINYRYN